MAFSQTASNDLTVLRNVSLSLTAGASLAIIGPSGSGKSTLLNIMGTLDKPTSGAVLIEGRAVSKMNDRTQARLRNRRIGFIFQLHHLLPQCTILENVLVPAILADNKTEAEQRARRLLDRVGLSHRLNHRPGHLSGGERQRAAVVRALVNRPVLLLADEPTGSLDRNGADNLACLLTELNREELVTLVMVTHSLELAGRMQQVLELKDGVLGNPPDIPST